MLVTNLFPIVDRNELIVHIASYDWDFRNFGPVELRFGSESVQCRYIASGTQTNAVVLKLALNDPQYDTVAEVAKKYGRFGGPVQIERSASATTDLTNGDP